jgi:hypothetical protein
MKWLTGGSGGARRRMEWPEHPAVAVRVYMQHKTSQRVALLLNPALVKGMRLQRGDRLMIGIAASGEIGLVRHKDGNAISGKGFSESRPNSKVGGGKSTPCVSFNTNVYSDLVPWATTNRNNWVLMGPIRDTVESDGVANVIWTSRGALRFSNRNAED